MDMNDILLLFCNSAEINREKEPTLKYCSFVLCLKIADNAFNHNRCFYVIVTLWKSMRCIQSHLYTILLNRNSKCYKTQIGIHLQGALIKLYMDILKISSVAHMLHLCNQTSPILRCQSLQCTDLSGLSLKKSQHPIMKSHNWQVESNGGSKD